MKALKSQLASDLLADPAAAGHLRAFLASQGGAARNASSKSSAFIVRGKNGAVKVTVSLVPKAVTSS